MNDIIILWYFGIKTLSQHSRSLDIIGSWRKIWVVDMAVKVGLHITVRFYNNITQHEYKPILQRRAFDKCRQYILNTQKNPISHLCVLCLGENRLCLGENPGWLKASNAVHWLFAKDQINDLTHWRLGDADVVVSMKLSNSLSWLMSWTLFFYEIALRWMPRDLIDVESALDQVMNWCC